MDTEVVSDNKMNCPTDRRPKSQPQPQPLAIILYKDGVLPTKLYSALIKLNLYPSQEN
jgi:hypothetical protein